MCKSLEKGVAAADLEDYLFQYHSRIEKARKARN